VNWEYRKQLPNVVVVEHSYDLVFSRYLVEVARDTLHLVSVNFLVYEVYYLFFPLNTGFNLLTCVEDCGHSRYNVRVKRHTNQNYQDIGLRFELCLGCYVAVPYSSNGDDSPVATGDILHKFITVNQVVCPEPVILDFMLI